MSLHKSTIKKAFCLFLVAASLTACGFQPLHGKRQTAQNTAMQSELTKVWIEEIKDREGQLLHNELLNLFNIKGRPQTPKYRLKINYSETQSGLGISKDEFATRANLHVQADFSFSGPVSLTGNSQSVVSFNILTSPTGTEFAKRDARSRAIRVIARDIHRRIAVHLLNPPRPAKADKASEILE